MPFSNITRSATGWLLVTLLIITFSLGALLTLTLISQREIKASLKEVKQELKQEKSETQLQKDNFNGCLGSLAALNQRTAEQQEAARLSADQSSALALNTMAKLPDLIKKDRASAEQPAAATTWLRGLFQ